MNGTSLPPGPRLPTLTQSLLWVLRPIAFMERCARRYGDIFTLRWVGAGTVVFVSVPAAIKEVFTGDPDVLDAAEANAILAPLLGTQSLLLLDGEAHLRHRRMLLPPFHGNRMQAYAGVIQEVTDRSLDGWPLGAPFSVHHYTQRIALDVILRAVFGVPEQEVSSELFRALTQVLDLIGSPSALPYLLTPRWLQSRLPRWWGAWGRFVELRLQLRDAVDKLILDPRTGRRRSAPADGSGQDILSLLLEAKDEEGQPLTDSELRDELITLLVAGHETTASALAWAFERILSELGVAERISAEIQAVAGDGSLAPAHFTRLEYLDAVVKETLRLRPVVAIVGRRLRAPFEVAGHRLPEGVFLAPCIYLTHRRPDIYPEPERFRPERFLEHRPDPYAWLPFGGGMRRCIGMAFALFEMKVVLATVFRRAQLRLASARPIRTRRRLITLVPSGGTPVVLLERVARSEAAGGPPKRGDPIA